MQAINFLALVAAVAGACNKPYFVDFPQADGSAIAVVDVCEEITYQIKAKDDDKDNVSIFVSEDPGLPNGATVSKGKCPSPTLNPDSGELESSKCSVVERTFTFQPAKSQVDKVYQVCFRARDDSHSCQAGGQYGDEACFKFRVRKPSPFWERAPTPVNMKTFTGHVGCTTTFTVECRDVHYCVNVWSSKVNPLPKYSTLSQCARYTADAESGVKSCQKCARTFSWKPRRGQESFKYSVCFHCSDELCDQVLHDGHNQLSMPALAVIPQTCVQINVLRCKYCVKAGDTLAFLNRYYHLDSNWLRLWNSNGAEDLNNAATTTIRNPDQLLDNEQVINIGPQYKVQHADTLLTLARRFHTTVKKILSINPDVDGTEDLKIGQYLCVMPCTDSPNYMTYNYNDHGPHPAPGGHGSQYGQA